MSGPLLTAKFDPTHTHLASAVRALDNHQIKVQAVTTTEGSLHTSFSLAKNQYIGALEWISSSQIALGLTNGTVLVYTPAENRITAEWQCPSNSSVLDCHYSSITRSTWVSDAAGHIYEWDISSHTLLQTLTLPELLDSPENAAKMTTVLYSNEPHLLVGTHNVYLIDLLAQKVVNSFPAHVQPVAALVSVPSDPDIFLTAAQGDRFVNVYSIRRKSTKAVLVAPTAVSNFTLGYCGDLSIVVAITETGALEVFQDPLATQTPQPQDQNSAKKRRKQLAGGVRSRHPDASVIYTRPLEEIRTPDDARLTVCAVSATEGVLHTTWLEKGTIARFDSVPWHRNGEHILKGSISIEKSRQEIAPARHTSAGHDLAAPRLYSEQHTVVTEGNAFQNDAEDADAENDQEETFADRMEKLAGAEKSNKKDQGARKKFDKTSPGSIAVVLAQALRSNDHALLETALASRDPRVVQQTVTRLDAGLAAVLVERLAERLSRQQRRFHHIGFWLKWTVVIHGGVLSSSPQTRRTLDSVHAVLTKKSSALPRILELQGRLDMLEQSRSLRKEILNGSPADKSVDDGDSDVEYVEEIDDAMEAGVLGSDDEDDDEDIDMDAADDYSEDEDDAEQFAHAGDDEDGLSDVETAVVNKDVYDDEE